MVCCDTGQDPGQGRCCLWLEMVILACEGSEALPSCWPLAGLSSGGLVVLVLSICPPVPPALLLAS